MLRQKCFIGNDDKIAYLSGSFSHGTSFMEINTVKEVLDGDENLTLPDVTNNGK